MRPAVSRFVVGRSECALCTRSRTAKFASSDEVEVCVARRDVLRFLRVHVDVRKTRSRAAFVGEAGALWHGVRDVSVFVQALRHGCVGDVAAM